MRRCYQQITFDAKSCYRTTTRTRTATSTHQASNFSTSIAPLLPPQNPCVPITKRRTQRQELVKLLQNPNPNNPFSHYKTVHGHIVVLGFQSDTFLSNILISLYAKAGWLIHARRLFDKMSQRNVVTWSSMISVYVQHGCSEEALMVFLEFRRSSNEKPNEFTLASVIRACTQLGGVEDGTQLHGLVVKIGFDQDVYVGTSLMDFYSKNNEIDQARLVFDEISVKSAVTWTTLMTGYARIGRNEVSLQLFSAMRDIGVVPDGYVLSSVLSSCSMLEFLQGGKQIHAYVLRRGMEDDVSVCNVLIDFYVKCGRVRIGQKLFDHMAVKNVISWTTMISGYMQNSFDWEAMKLFMDMNRLGWKPDGFACTSILTSCASLEALEQGKQIHAYAIKANLESDGFVQNGLIDMYSKCNCLTDARRSFDGIVYLSVIPYNTMIEGYSRQEKLYEALDLFHEMRIRSFSPSLLTFVSILGMSASLFTMELSQQIHCVITKLGISVDIFAGSALIDVYSKCSFIKDARLVFEEMNDKDIVVWNAMLSGYAQQLENEEALKLYLKLQHSGKKPNEFTFVALITAASNFASLPQGQQFHNQLIKTGLDFDPFVTNAVVDMYAKCGSIEEARKMFDSTTSRDVVCWNSMITTYAQHGQAEEALEMFEEMIKEGIEPTYVTFVGVLSACGHVGLVKDGLRHFESMSTYGIEPGTEHYACVVSLLGRAGKLSEAKNIIERMPIQPEAIVWRSLLSACRVVGHVELGTYAAEMAISVDPKDSGSYVLLSNIFASKGMWVDVKKVRERMDRSGVVKEAGCSWIELNNEVHVFVARDKGHPDADLIWLVLDNLVRHIKGVSYAPDIAAILTNDFGEIHAQFPMGTYIW